MKGKILGMATATGIGAISGEDGVRYSFAATEWRSDKAVAAGIAVDFDAEGTAARDVYPAIGSGGTGGVPIDFGAMATSPAAGRIREMFTATLAVPLALLVLLAFFLPALSSPVMGVSQIGIGKAGQMLGSSIGMVSDHASARIAELAKQEGRIRTSIAQLGPDARTDSYPFDSYGERLASIAEARAAAEAAADSQSFFALVGNLMVLRFVAPIAALVLLWFAWTNKPLGRLPLIAGAAAIVAGGLTIAFKSAVVGMVTASNPFAGAMVGAGIDNLVSIGIGVWLLILAGIGLILSGMGLIRNPLATAAA